MTRAVGALLAAFFVAQTPPRDATPRPATNTATIRGRVVAAVTGDPIRNARVSVKAGRDFPPVLTDGEGRFECRDLPTSDMTLTASKPGFARTSIDIPRDTADAVVVRLQRGAAISGLVVDETGEPIPGASVMVERVEDGSHTVKTPTVGMTDETGRYRIGSLSEGRVLVSTFGNARSVVMLPDGAGMLISGPGGSQRRIYYPGGMKADSGEPLVLQPGDEKLAVDFAIPANIPNGPRVRPAPRDVTVLSGRIMTVDGRPVTGAQVTLASLDFVRVVARQTVSDADGAYQFVMPQDVSATFRIVAFRTGYLRAAYGQRAPTDPAQDLVVAGGETRANLDVVMSRPGTITGRLFDENGDPVESALVRAMRLAFSDGRRRLEDVPFARFGPGSDDLGRYRIAGLAPGKYFVSAIVGQIVGTDSTADLPGYAQTYYPGTPNAAEGQFVSVGRSQDVSGVDFSIVRTKTARVAGMAFDAAGEPVTGGLALIPSRRSGSLVAMQIGARIERDGRFEFFNVPPGDYVLQVSRHRNGAWSEGESASQFVTVDGVDITGLEVRTTPGSTIVGRIAVDEGTTLGPGQIELSPIPSDSDVSVMLGGGPARALVDRDLRFEIAGLHGPRRLRATRLPPGWAVKAVRHNGSDITDALLPFGRAEQSLTEVEVVLTTHGPEIGGTVVDDRNRPVAEAAVVAFAPDRGEWYGSSRFVGYADAGRDGTFTIRGLAPGDYYVAVVDKRQIVDILGEIENPDFLESLVVGSQRVTLDEGQRISVALRLAAR